MHAQRGQTLPVWTFGILSALMLSLMLFNYASGLRWQIRAQNAADAVAQGVMSVQSQHYNQILMNLHASAVEEWRIRRTLNAMLVVLQGSGGCQTGTTPTRTGDGRDCATVYNNLRANYIADVARYTTDVQNMAALTQYTQTQQIADMNAIAASFQTTCTTAGAAGGDCVFNYTVTNPTARTNLSGVANDAGGTIVGAGYALPATPTDLQPLEIEVIACAVVNSPFQSFFKMNVQPFTAVGRAAATSGMIIQEWSAPGVQTNPNNPNGSAFQPPEFPESSTNAAPASASAYTAADFCTNSNGNGYDWYAVHYCSNAWTAVYTAPNPGNPAGQLNGFHTRVVTDEYSVWTGWWGALPIPPYNVATAFTPNATNCAQNVPWSHT
jgi:hypothetical protein